MEWHRMKTIIIVILLVINGFLLVLVGTRRSESLRYEQSALEHAARVLETHGIDVEEKAVVSTAMQSPCASERSSVREEDVAAALLGQAVESSDLGGGLYSYTADSGTVSFRTGGEIATVLTDDPMWYTTDPVGHSSSLMSAMKVDFSLSEAQMTNGTGEVTYQQMLKKTPLFSCRVTFYYESGRLTGLSGRLLAVEKIVEEEGETLALPTILMGFLDEVLSSGDVCSSVLTVEPGYLLAQSFANTVRLQPVWYISTNTADYYVDGITGELTRVVQGLALLSAS